MKVVTWLTVITSARRASASTALLLWRSRIRICLQVHCSYNSRSFFVWLYAALTASVARPLPSTSTSTRARARASTRTRGLTHPWADGVRVCKRRRWWGTRSASACSGSRVLPRTSTRYGRGQTGIQFR